MEGSDFLSKEVEFGSTKPFTRTWEKMSVSMKRVFLTLWPLNGRLRCLLECEAEAVADLSTVVFSFIEISWLSKRKTVASVRMQRLPKWLDKAVGSRIKQCFRSNVTSVCLKWPKHSLEGPKRERIASDGSSGESVVRAQLCSEHWTEHRSSATEHREQSLCPLLVLNKVYIKTISREI